MERCAMVTLDFKARWILVVGGWATQSAITLGCIMAMRMICVSSEPKCLIRYTMQCAGMTWKQLLFSLVHS